MMKIGFLTIDYTWDRGGERVSATLANELSLQMEVHLLSLYKQNETPFFEISDRVIVHVLTKAINDRSIPRLSFIKRKRAEIASLMAHLQETRYDVLIGVGSYTSILLGISKALINNKTRMVAWEHSNYHAISTIWKRIRKIAYYKLEAVICLNKEDQSIFASRFKTTYTIPNLISFTSEQKSTLSAKQIICIGAYEHEKGFDLLLRAFKDLSEAVPDWELTLIGSGSLKETLKETIQNLELGSRVRLLDPVKDIRQEFLKASIYVMPSRREGFGMVLVEAMECGLACISFDCPTGPRNIIDPGINGILVPPGDTRQLANAIENLILHPNELKRLANAGILSAKSYYKEIIVDHWMSFLNKASKGESIYD